MRYMLFLGIINTFSSVVYMYGFMWEDNYKLKIGNDVVKGGHYF